MTYPNHAFNDSGEVSNRDLWMVRDGYAVHVEGTIFIEIIPAIRLIVAILPLNLKNREHVAHMGYDEQDILHL
ncbi:MAG TPA: hypothetical protein EYQ50_09120 [Verrucomicrobiales bacterium]|nr:hypothetical protein [Verrucomicrobiales bacterium]